jgi:L-Ala-D/L-Glu epimerase
MNLAMLRAELKTLHLSEPFRIAHGASSVRQILRLYEGEAVGESPFPPYYAEKPADALAWLEGNREGEPSPAGQLALDLLQLDQGSEPLWKLAQTRLGPGKPWEGIHACRSLSIPTDLGAFSERVADVSRQFRVLKLKLGSGDLEYDDAIVATARAAAPHAMVFADVNGGWSVDEAVEMRSRLRPYGLLLVEQPIHHHLEIEAWAELKCKSAAGALPVFADESARDAADVARLVGLVDGVNVKLLKCGTFRGAIEMIAAARGCGMGVILGCMIESSIGVTAAAHLAPWADYVDLDGHLYLADDDYRGILFDDQGRIVMPQGGGIGGRLRE